MVCVENPKESILKSIENAPRTSKFSKVGVQDQYTKSTVFLYTSAMKTWGPTFKKQYYL